MSALLDALNSKDEASLRDMLEARAPGASIPENEAHALLCVAASDTDGRWLRMLLDAGIDPNALQQPDDTALSYAEHFGRTANAALLRERGAK